MVVAVPVVMVVPVVLRVGALDLTGKKRTDQVTVRPDVRMTVDVAAVPMHGAAGTEAAHEKDRSGRLVADSACGKA